MKEALRAALDSREAKINGYPHSAGLVEARAAIADMSSSESCKLTHEVLRNALEASQGIGIGYGQRRKCAGGVLVHLSLMGIP